MGRVISVDVEFGCGCDIKECYELLERTSKKHNVIAKGLFNGKEINSSMSLDECFEVILGMSEKEFEDRERKQLEEMKKHEEEFKSSIPSLIEEYCGKARGVISEDRLSRWDKIVPIRLGDLYEGMELECTLELVKALDIEGCSLEEGKKIINKQGHSGMSFMLMKSMLLEFCIRGKEFVDYIS